MSETKTHTLFGGVAFNATLADGTSEEIRIRQLPLAEYEKTFPLVDDEFALLAAIVAKSKDWVLNLSPESYEEAAKTAREVNEKGFFSWAVRKMTKQLDQAKMLLSAIPASQIESLTKLGQSASQTSSPSLRPRQT